MLNEEYERIKKDYSNLIAVFQKSITNNNTKIHHEFNSLEEFENAVDLGKFDLEQYSIKEINKLILDLEKLENKANDRKLEEFDLKTIEDFHRVVDMGILNINKYSISEINELLNTLSDNT